jgi:hypothetical protein
MSFGRAGWENKLKAESRKQKVVNPEIRNAELGIGNAELERGMRKS